MILIMSMIEQYHGMPSHDAESNRTHLWITTFRGANHTHPSRSYLHDTLSDSITDHRGRVERRRLHPGCLPTKSGVTLISVLHKSDLFTKQKWKPTYLGEICDVKWCWLAAPTLSIEDGTPMGQRFHTRIETFDLISKFHVWIDFPVQIVLPVQIVFPVQIGFPVRSLHIGMQYMIQNNVHPYFQHKFVSREVASPYVLTELPLRISVTQFLSTVQNSPQEPWLLNNVIVNEVHCVHITITFVHWWRARLY